MSHDWIVAAAMLCAMASILLFAAATHEPRHVGQHRRPAPASEYQQAWDAVVHDPRAGWCGGADALHPVIEVLPDDLPEWDAASLAELHDAPTSFDYAPPGVVPPSTEVLAFMAAQDRDCADYLGWYRTQLDKIRETV
jgi:hypothetical protein